jgi:plastocyanin
VSREELVERYLDGQLSRRVFIRRLVATGVTTVAALSYASILEALPAEAALGDFYLVIQDFAFAFNPAKLTMGQRVDFANHSFTYQHTATDTTGMGLFNTGPIPVEGEAFVTIPSAGTYPYHCAEPTSVHPAMNAQLKAPVMITPASGTVNTTFTVKWASSALPAGYVADVQRKAPGAMAWMAWKTGVTAISSTFKTSARGTWSFRARLRRTSNGKMSGWSNPKTVSIT